MKQQSLRFILSYLAVTFNLLFGLLHSNITIADTADYDLSPWAKVLESFVDEKGFVDYKALNQDRVDLDSFIRTIEATGPTSNPQAFADSDSQLAYYINAYNALVFQGVLSRGPEQKSVWSGLISGLNFFVRMKINLDGKETNLRNLENKIIRDKYRDPRIHAALVCASVSCPKLIREPYQADILDAQLEMAMREFVATNTNVRVDDEKKTVHLSEIFDWFDSDFLEYEKSQGVAKPNLIDYVNRYLEEGSKISRNYKVKFIKYDKRINDQDIL